ncbi:MFS transporter [Longimicrobium sp.]|uniref:MFS transporter n=1 Tax=Longimicrobium sp. TaxID=2029185 RepID=UPI002E36B1DF|nr:MFS transporter [Longimicrobium sp.]HEX6036971.1 MFS transporter [Longimicrobium sp.]
MAGTTQQARVPLRQVLREMGPFSVIWFGQLVSGLGSGLTGFALPVWIYQKTGSAEAFGLLFFAATVPAVLMSPFAGALVDRWSRKTVLIASDGIAAVFSLVIAGLVLTNQFEIWHLFVISVLSSAVGTFSEPAFSATMGMLVPRQHFTRASGLLHTSGAVNGIVTPLLAGVLVSLIGLGGIILIDFVTFLVAVATLARVHIPQPPASNQPRKALLREAHDGWMFIRARRGLFLLLLYFPAVNLLGGMVNPLFSPMVLSFATPAQLGVVVSVSSLGMLAGGMLLSAWGGPRNKVRGLVLGQLLGAASLMTIGLRPSLPLVGAAMFMNLVLMPTSQSCSQAIWLSKTPQEMMGRVLAIRRMLALSTTPIAALACGPLADRVFNPLMQPGGALAGSVGRVLGVGPGRGIALMYVLIAGFLMAMSALLYAHPRVRRLEDEVPDAVPARPAPEPVMPAPQPAAAGA